MTCGPWWRLQPSGQPEGPFGEREMREALASGRLHVTDPIWSPTASDWGSFDTLFPRDSERDPRPPIREFATSLTAFAAAGAAIVALTASYGPWDYAALPAIATLRTVWIALAVVMAVATVSVTRFGLSSAAKLRRRPRTRRILRAAAIGCGSLGSVLVIVQGVAATAIPDDMAEVATYRFTVNHDADPRRIVVEGDVGIGFGKAVADALAGAPDPVHVEIDSGGGLASEALEAAHAIEARAGATVVARRECVSACTIVLMSGHRRLAETDMTIDFHALSLVQAESKRSTLFGFDLSLFIARYWGDGYLEDRGVPADIIAEANRRGHEDVYPVPAETLMERGVLTGLVAPLPRRDPASDDDSAIPD